MTSALSFAQTVDYNTKKGYAVHGYDVVSYFDESPKEGKEGFTAMFDGTKFKFYDQENLTKFKDTPFTDMMWFPILMKAQRKVRRGSLPCTMGPSSSFMIRRI